MDIFLGTYRARTSIPLSGYNMLKAFFPQDFITDASGRTWLKPGAVPKPIWPVVSSQW
ncbi:unnamed protein product [Acanthoscelides obtectus]|uniref:Uncharacterized protein n=1 Tax=Acanthoscelides obtectus TaxID=200917 RepID=A0A9P0P5K9_ACAOB|nr:unnamed protein product [Acanthoscelides obtectus]CAK1633574.1 hypothetical protein AOBTE_LOCUS8230 [Acanthoscelides obtectus]